MRRFLPILLFCGAALSGTARAGESVVIPGSGASEVLLRQLADAYRARHPGEDIRIPPSIGSSGGIRAVMANEVPIARIARPLRETEIRAGLRALVFARDAVVFATGERVGPRALSSAQLVDVYAGKFTNWQQLGDGSGPIRLLRREPGDASLDVLRRSYPAFRDLAISDQAKLVNHDFEMLELLDKYHTAIGWITQSSLPGARTRLGVLVLDGVPATAENMRSGRFAATIEFSFVFREGRLGESAGRFVDFVFSPEGRQVLERAGALPVVRK